MRTVRVIPCLDVDRGRVVKGVGFVDLVDAGDPAELAARYDAEGADEVVLLDITASSDNRETLLGVVERTADALTIPLTVGGGVRSVDDAKRLLSSGADKVSVNTAALANPGLVSAISATYGAQCVVVAIDLKRRGGCGWEVVTHGGRRPTGIDGVSWAMIAERLGAGEVLITSMDKDGTKSGYDLELMAAIGAVCTIPIIASGGVGDLDDLVRGATVGGADALLAASIFHFGTHTVGEAKERLAAAGVAVRPPEGA